MTKARGGVHTVRRLVCYLLLLILVSIAATGLSGLLDRLLSSANNLIAYDSSGLAQALAFSLIAGPLAAILWWLCWRKPVISEDRHSLLWPIYLVIMTATSLLSASFGLFNWAGELLTGQWTTSGLSTGIVWALIWLWHYWMWRHPQNSPTRMIGVAPAISWFIGLWMAVGGAIAATTNLIDNAVSKLTNSFIAGDDWTQVLHALPWIVGGLVIWWWHWYRTGVRKQTSGFASVLFVLAGALAGTAMFLVGATLLIYVILRLLVTADKPIYEALESLGLGISLAGFGALVILFHRRTLNQRGAEVHTATRLVTAGVALIAFASGFGVTINALLSAISEPLVATDIRPLLLAGLSALVAGGALWWVAWRPSARVAATDDQGRRIYLIVVFGLSALTALITLLVIGYQLFAFLLDEGSGESFLERSRQAIGVLLATLLVAIYHFVLWRRERSTAPAVAHSVAARLVTLVAGSADAAEAVSKSTGVKVRLLRRTTPAEGELEPDALGAAAASAVSAAESAQLLIIAREKGKLEVIPLDD
ncbi:MAG: DUF5671 domain-containing protein [Homoserinimonas sp.]|nr:DUF5671 domain-containing protein [Homoserinimonas sp.]